MAKKKSAAVPGLEFRHVITAEINGRPVENVQPLEFVWAQSFATEWHEGHVDSALHGALVDMRKRVKRARADFTKGRR